MGERETPIPVLVKTSKLIKVSLDDLILSPLQLNEFASSPNKVSSDKNRKNLKQTSSVIEHIKLTRLRK